MSREPAEDSSPPEQPLSDAARAGRLQRAPGADGYRVDSFIDVVKRHGLTMACLAGLCLLTPGALPLLAQTTRARASVAAASRGAIERLRNGRTTRVARLMTSKRRRRSLVAINGAHDAGDDVSRSLPELMRAPRSVPASDR